VGKKSPEVLRFKNRVWDRRILSFCGKKLVNGFSWCDKLSAFSYWELRLTITICFYADYEQSLICVSFFIFYFSVLI
jgi:hypothetical protein